MRMSIEAADAEIISRWQSDGDEPLSLLLVATKDERMARFRAFVKELKLLIPRLKVVTDQGADADPPSFQLGTAFRFLAIPSGGELRPFLDLLGMSGSAEPTPSGLSEEAMSRLSEVRWPADIKMYMTPQCPHCPQVLRQVQALALSSPLLHLTVIDGMLFPEVAAQDGVRSVPTLILDGHFRWTGSLSTDELIEALVHRNPSQLSTKALKDFLKEGNAARLADMMLQQNAIFPAFPDLVVHPEWSVRLGAIVAVEELAEQNLALARQLLPELWARLDGLDMNIKGDVAYLLGELGTAEWIPRLEALLAGEQNEPLRDVIEEALAKLPGLL